MVKFSKQMELQLVPEWRHKFCNYWQLKKEIKRMKLQKAPSNPSEQHHRQQGEVPAGKRPDAGASWTPLSTFTRRSMHPWAYEDIIKVHERKGDSQEDGHYGYLYETEIVEGVSINDLEKEFFKCLDQELNKVNRFFFAKEQEFLERAEILSRQLTSLSEIHQAYNNTVAQFDRPAQLDSKANDAVPSDAFTPTKSRILHSLFNRLSKFKELLYSRALPYSAYTDSNSGRYKRDETDTEENSRHPLNPHATDEDQSTKPECTMITVGSLDGEEEKIRNEKKSKVCEVNAKTSDLYDDEDWTLDRLFNQIHTSVKHEDINSTPSGGISISNLIRMLSQRLPWETSRRHQQAAGNKEQHLKEEEREEGSLADNYDTCMNDSCHKKTENGAAQSVRLGASYGSLATQRSFGDGMASLRKIITARGEEHLRLDENCVSLSKIKHARKMLRTAFVEFYRGLGLLRTFRSLPLSKSLLYEDFQFY